MKRNALLDYLRLVFSFIVMFYHFYDCGLFVLFKAGSFGVEFFGVLAGFLFFSDWSKNKEISDSGGWRKRYLFKRYSYFFSYAFVAFVIAFLVVRVWINESSVTEMIKTLSGDIWEILLVKIFGFNRGENLLNGPAWTLGCMFFSEFLISGFLCYWEKPYLTLFMPVSVIFGTAYWMNMENPSWMLFMGWFTFGMLRIYLLTCSGIISFILCMKLKKTCFTKAGKIFLTIVEVMGYFVCVLISLFVGTRDFLFCFILTITVCIALSFSGATYTSMIIIDTKYSRFCAELSLGIYLMHFSVLHLFSYIYPNEAVMRSHWLSFLSISLLVSLMYLYFMRFLMKKILPALKRFLFACP